MPVREVELPGVGKKYTVETRASGQVVVVLHQTLLTNQHFALFCVGAVDAYPGCGGFFALGSARFAGLIFGFVPRYNARILTLFPFLDLFQGENVFDVVAEIIDILKLVAFGKTQHVDAMSCAFSAIKRINASPSW